MAAQKTRSFSLRKNESPIIENFIKEQGNFSESIRYLIIKYCKENGVENVSKKLLELLYGIESNSIPLNRSEEKSPEINIDEKIKNKDEFIEKKQEKNKKIEDNKSNKEVDIYAEYL